MDDTSWFILIYQTSDAEAQERLADSLKALGGLVIEATQSNGEFFVVIECSGQAPALTMHELVMELDCEAVLIDCHAGQAEPAPSVVGGGRLK